MLVFAGVIQFSGGKELKLAMMNQVCINVKDLGLDGQSFYHQLHFSAKNETFFFTLRPHAD